MTGSEAELGTTHWGAGLSLTVKSLQEAERININHPRCDRMFFTHTRNSVKRRRGVDPSRCKLTLWEGCCPVLHHGDRILILKFLSNTNERERPVTEYKQATSGQAPVEWIGSDEGRHNNRSFTFDTKLVLRKRFLDTKYDFFLLKTFTWWWHRKGHWTHIKTFLKNLISGQSYVENLIIDLQCLTEIVPF